QPALWQQDHVADGFEWLGGPQSAADASVLAFIRWSTSGDPVVVLVNFSGAPVHDYRTGLPRTGRWRELLNTDAAEFAGSGVGNLGAVDAGDEPFAARPASAVLTLPPLAALWLAPED